ncbi:hypothetical protein OV079_26205 [Nannocystis pusilla]|uniref:Uncharacterized protein n=1 Tax=Nannocystis pusilla TaxID=889268 RepID=A0A9X3F091_9BACT|nr:hypothetical protein [Nannocystis pusilla]MCY1008988.1 hypothetical protein [Nannocystis pusilla]
MGWSLIETPLSLALPASREGETSLVDTVADPDHESASDVLDRERLHEQLKKSFPSSPRSRPTSCASASASTARKR